MPANSIARSSRSAAPLSVLGEHKGLIYHTIGQRQGLGIGGLANHDEAPWYVVEKVVGENALIVVQGNDHPALFKNSLTANGVIWISDQPPALPLRSKAKIRYRQADQACTITSDGDCLSVTFDNPQRAVRPGQSVVFYEDQVCLGGGVIESAT